MKIETNTFEVTRSGSFSEKGFGIANNRKAFDILSSKIYTDVPLAIVRELSTNASDSHVEAGRADQPFEVHLPNSLEPWLTIRDFGTGLSPDVVADVYTTYFKSTRSTSDEFTGCLGLGSKSPFAYADQFTIVSNWNGRKFTYSAFKNEEGCPSLAMLSEVATKEHNGLEIRIAIKPGDVRLFLDAAQRVYSVFKVRPTIKGATLTFDQRKPIVETENFSLVENQSGSRITVIMGQVAYTVDQHQVNIELGYYTQLNLFMPIGSCSISASREEIHYDPKTIANVKKATKAAMDHAREVLAESVTTETTVFGKLRSLAKYRNVVPNLSVSGIEYISGTEKDKYTLKSCSIRRGEKLFIDNYVNELRGGNGGVAIVEEDIELTQNFKNRLRQFIRTGNATVYLATIKDQARVAELFGDVVVKLSSLPDVPRTPRDPNSRTMARSKPIKLMSNVGRHNMNNEWSNIHASDEVDTKDACCVIRDGNWIMWKGQKCKPETARRIASLLGFERVYGIAEKRFESLKNKLGIEVLEEVAAARAQKIIDGMDMYALAKFQHSEEGDPANIDLNKIKGLSTECDDFVKMHKAKVENATQYMDLCKIFNIKVPTATNYGEIFYKKYPLLTVVSSYSMNVKALTTDYIKLVEGI